MISSKTVAGLSKRERRNHFRGKPRPGRRVEVSFTGEDGTRERAHTRNIGVGGAFVVTKLVQPVGHALTVELTLPSSDVVFTLPSVVRWADGEGMGVQFVGVDVDVLLELNDYFASLTGRDYSGVP